MFAIALAPGCGSTNSGPEIKHDAALDRPDTGKLDVPGDSPKDVVSPSDAVTCTLNGQSFAVGATVPMPGPCATCRCLAGGVLGDCAAGCPIDGPADSRPPIDGPGSDPPVSCVRSGVNYTPGQTVPMNDGCGGSCVCMADGTLSRCVNTCTGDGGRDLPDAPNPDLPADRPPEIPPIDTACTVGTACTLASGGKGLCPAGSCKACVGAQDDAKCASLYGSGTICAAGECVTGTCHDSTTCAGSKVCDATHTCRNCASDLQCQNDPAYGRGTICLASGQCATGTCHTSTDCLGKKLCDAAVHTCSACTTDTQCQADAVYGSKSICVASQCVAGTCASSTDCKSSGRLCPTATKVCTACTADSQCRNDSAYGAGNICVDGQCVSGSCSTSASCSNGRICNATSRVCVACSTDTQCRGDSVYGQHTLCLSGGCTTGDCHDNSSDCSAGRICGSTVPHACGDCTTDAQCTADARYGSGHICVGNLCVQGNCHDTSNECTGARAGLVCGADSAHTCGTCNDDGQCKNDTKYGANTICTTTAGLTTTGQCVSNACTSNGQACAANSGDFCCNSKCVAGNCCADAQCTANTAFGTGYFCRQNTCTRCDEPTGNNYLVDPVNGNDGIATGAATAGGTATAGCAFRTVTRALQALGTSAATGTTITIVGSTTGTTSLLTVAATGAPSPETLPIQIPANVTVTTKTGPIKLTLPSGKGGFRLIGDKAQLAPAGVALLTIDGNNHLSGAGIVVAAGTGTVALSNLTVTNTGEDGIQVTEGTVNVGAGVRVTGAGTASSKQNGLHISGGTVNILVGATATATVFENNTQSGIALTAGGVLNVTGAATTNGERSVIVRDNGGANVDFGQTPVTATPTSTLDGLYSFAAAGDGLLVAAGSRLKVRNSVFLGNIGNGIRVTAVDTNKSVAGIDLGTTGAGTAPGHNVLQSTAGNDPNTGAGLCVDLGEDAGTQTLRAVGNQFAGVNCATGTGSIRLSTSCASATDLGVVTATGSTLTVNTASCSQTSL